MGRLRRRRREPRRLRVRLRAGARRRRLPADHVPARTTARWSGGATAACGARASTRCCRPPSRPAGCAPRSTPRATGWARCSATPTPGSREVRASHPDAGGLVLAADQDHARAIAARLATIAGEPPELVMSDEPAASARLAEFSASRRRWLVSVLMVSEGVDIPRLRVGVYATPARTELFFRQVVGRFIRRTPAPARQMSYLLLPGRLAPEAARRRDRGGAQPRARAARRREDENEPLEPARGARRGPRLRGAQLDGRPARRGDPRRDDDAAVRHGGRARSGAPPQAAPSPARPRARTRCASGCERSAARLVALVAGRTREQHRVVHARVNRATGARSVGAATREQLERGNELLQRELRR